MGGVDSTPFALAGRNPTLDSGAGLILGYSLWSDHLYYFSIQSPPTLRSIGLPGSECFTTATTVLGIPSGEITRGFTISPDGRWGVGIGLENPRMSIIRIHRDGSLQLHQQFSYTTARIYNTERVRFTHDGRYLILLTDGPDDLISYRYDPGTDLWVEVTHAQFPGGAFDFSVTPDDRYLVWIQNYPGYGKDGYYYTTLQAVQINDDGSFTYLPGKSLVVKGYMATLEFIPPLARQLSRRPERSHGVLSE